VRAHIDYHVQVGKHYYSVPYQLVKKELEARLTATVVEVFYQGRRVASHRRSRQQGRYTTVPEHMPKGHRHYAEWTPERLVRWAGQTGGSTAEVVQTILSSRPHPQQGFRSCLGIMSLGKQYVAERLEAACRRALALQATGYKSIQSILKHGLESQPLPQAQAPERKAIVHGNVRGAVYYAESLFGDKEEGGRPC